MNETPINEQPTINPSNVEASIVVTPEKKDWVEEAIQREATPSPKRQETVEEFSRRHGIDPSTYYYNMRKKENKRKVVEIWLNEALVGGNEVLEALREKAKAGDTKAIELYMKFVLELAENLDIKSDGRPIIQIVNQIATKYEATPSSSDNSTGQN